MSFCVVVTHQVHILLRIHILIISLLACPITEHLFVCFRFLEISVAKPGQNGHKFQVLPSCPISDLRRKVAEICNVKPERFMLIYKFQTLLNEDKETKRTKKVEDYIVREDNTGTYFVKEQTIPLNRLIRLVNSIYK